MTEQLGTGDDGGEEGGEEASDSFFSTKSDWIGFRNGGGIKFRET